MVSELFSKKITEGQSQSVSPPKNENQGRRSRNIFRLVRDHAPLVLGISASLSYGMWGIFEKLAGPNKLAFTNLIVYTTAFLLSLAGLSRWRPPSISALVAGLSGGAINVLVLYALSRHSIVLVYPFVSFGSLIFIGLSFFLRGGQTLTRSRPLMLGGTILAIAGLAMCGIGLSGGLVIFQYRGLDVYDICLGVLTSILAGLWLFLAFTTVVEQQYAPSIATMWVFLGSLCSALILLPLVPPHSYAIRFDSSTAYAIAAGAFMFLGEYSTYHAFRLTPKSSQRLEQAITALLANSELVPIIIFSLIIFRDWSSEGIIGALLVLLGLYLLNESRA